MVRTPKEFCSPDNLCHSQQLLERTAQNCHSRSQTCKTLLMAHIHSYFHFVSYTLPGINPSRNKIYRRDSYLNCRTLYSSQLNQRIQCILLYIFGTAFRHLWEMILLSSLLGTFKRILCSSNFL